MLLVYQIELGLLLTPELGALGHSRQGVSNRFLCRVPTVGRTHTPKAAAAGELSHALETALQNWRCRHLCCNTVTSHRA
jgi:hypothetical protein